MANANMALMKEINLNTLRYTMRRIRKASKPQLSELTGLSVVTVNALVRELCDTGELVEESVPLATGGRPAAVYRFNSRYRLALSICVQEYRNRETVFFSVNDLNGELLERDQRPLEKVSLRDFEEIIRHCLERYAAIGVIAFGLPGYEAKGRLVNVGRTPLLQLENTPFREHFQQMFGLPVLCENDVNLAAAGHCRRYRMEAGECVIGVYFPLKSMHGSGVCIGGEIYRGRDGGAGEIGYLCEVDWENFDPRRGDAAATVAAALLPMIALYNPHRMVLYGEWLPAGLITRLREELTKRIPEVLLPDFTLTPDMEEDFLAGAVHMALKTFEVDLYQ